MDGGAWWAAVHGIVKSRTRLSDFTFHFHALEKEMATHSSVLAWRIPGAAEPGGLPSMGSHRVGHDWSDAAAAAAAAAEASLMCWLCEWLVAACSIVLSNILTALISDDECLFTCLLVICMCFWENVFSEPLPIFNWIICHDIEFSEFFITFESI